MPNNKFYYYYFNGHVGILCANSALHLPRTLFSIREMMVGTKMNRVFDFRTKMGKKK